MALTPPVQAFTKQDFLDLIDRLFPEHYLDGLKEHGPGYELIEAFAAMFARLSTAVENLGRDAFIDLAGVGTRAAGEVELFRAAQCTIDNPIEGQSGSTASIVSGAPAGQMRVTGLTNMNAASVGNFLTISSTSDPNNAGTFEIITYNDETSVDVANASAVIPDGNNGSIAWLEVTRTVTVKAGTVVRASRGGQEFTTLDDVTFLHSDVGPFTVDVEAVSVGYEWNVPGQAIAADGTVLEGEIDEVSVLVEEPPLGDPTIEVRQILPTSGGTDAALAALGRNRGILQGNGEANASYRIRIRSLPDTVSFSAFERMIADLLRPYDAGFDIIETHEIAYQTAYDGPNTTIPGSAYDPNLFAYDDERDPVPFRNRWLSENDHRGGLIVVVENVQPLRDTGMVYDDPAPDVSSLVSSRTGGQRAASAYDVLPSFGFGAVQGGYDGFDLQKQGLYSGLYETLQSIKPAGAFVALELEGE